MLGKNEVYLDMSKLTPSQRKEVVRVLNYYKEDIHHRSERDLLKGFKDDNFPFLILKNDFWVESAIIKNKTEITLRQFKELFEHQFDQGDKVLWTDDLVYWYEGVFIANYKDLKIVDTEDGLMYVNEIKPYEDKIKIGD